MLEVIEGLKAAGVKTKDMFVYERYRDEFIGAGMHKDVPDGIAWGGLTPEDDATQLDIRSTGPQTGNDPVAGYDPDEFVEMDLVRRRPRPEGRPRPGARTWGCSSPSGSTSS